MLTKSYRKTCCCFTYIYHFFIYIYTIYSSCFVYIHYIFPPFFARHVKIFCNDSCKNSYFAKSLQTCLQFCCKIVYLYCFVQIANFNCIVQICFCNCNNSCKICKNFLQKIKTRNLFLFSFSNHHYDQQNSYLYLMH